MQGLALGWRLNNVDGKEGSRLEEAAWIRSVLAGHREDYRHLVSRYQGKVYQLCLKITKEPEAAKDLVQEIFLKAYKALPSFREEAAFSTWLYQIAYRSCLDWKRSSGRELQHRSQRPYEESDWVTRKTPEHILLLQEARDDLKRMLEKLKDPYRTVIQMYYFQSCTYQEIAKQTGVSVKTVESQLYRAKRLMRKEGGGEW
ncbi:RNA polymerase sigma factor [Paenibacillaceae bacterium]|nr:RNA polymerase sigma factor [Paenibacillaceae bacterium]